LNGLSTSTSSASSFETASASGDPGLPPVSNATTAANEATDTSGDVSGETSSDETVTPEPAATPKPKPKRNSPGGALRRHFQQLSNGNYTAAFHLMSSRYRSANPNWLDQPSAAQPYIHVASVGKARFVGPGVARVYVKFYGHDRYATDRSDTACRRFEGEARMVKENGRWRYDGGDDYTTTVLPSYLKACNP
jgi:hypothetical protein